MINWKQFNANEPEKEKKLPISLSEEVRKKNAEYICLNSVLNSLNKALHGQKEPIVYVKQFYQGVCLLYKHYKQIDSAYFDVFEHFVRKLANECKEDEEDRKSDLYRKAAIVFRIAADQIASSITLFSSSSEKDKIRKFIEKSDKFLAKMNQLPKAKEKGLILTHENLFDNAIKITDSRYPILKELLEKAKASYLNTKKQNYAISSSYRPSFIESGFGAATALIRSFQTDENGYKPLSKNPNEFQKKIQ